MAILLLWLETLELLLHLVVYFKPILLLSVQHIIALDVAHVTHVAHFSESKVVVEAPLAAPVTYSLGGGFLGSW